MSASAAGDGPRERIGAGIASMAVGIFCMAVMDAFAKWLGAAYPVQQVVFFRMLFALPAVLVLARLSGGLAGLRTVRPRVHLLRGALATVASFSFVTGLTFMPLAEATALAFAAPIFVTALSVPLIGEQVGLRRWSAVLVGFAGVLVIVRPGLAAFQPAALLILLTALCYALLMLTARRFASSESTSALVFYMTLVPLMVSAALLPLGWTAPGWADLARFVALGLLGGATMIFITLAFRLAPAAVVAPFDYTGLIWAAAIGWLVWRDIPGPFVWLGAAVIVASGLYIVRRETRRRPHSEAGETGTAGSRG